MGERRFALPFPFSRAAREGDTGGEGNQHHRTPLQNLPAHADN
jgi:hypothetical protein